jgi:hypothetical protein
MVYLIENADEICEEFQKLNTHYPPSRSAPQASSKTAGEDENSGK